MSRPLRSLPRRERGTVLWQPALIRLYRDWASGVLCTPHDQVPTKAPTAVYGFALLYFPGKSKGHAHKFSDSRGQPDLITF